MPTFCCFFIIHVGELLEDTASLLWSVDEHMTIVRVISVQNGHLDSHAIEIYNSPDWCRATVGGHALINTVDKIVQGTVRFTN